MRQLSDGAGYQKYQAIIKNLQLSALFSIFYKEKRAESKLTIDHANIMKPS